MCRLWESFFFFMQKCTQLFQLTDKKMLILILVQASDPTAEQVYLNLFSHIYIYF